MQARFVDFIAICGSRGAERTPIKGRDWFDFVELGLCLVFVLTRGVWYREGWERSGMEIRIGLPARDLVSDEYRARRTASKPASEGAAWEEREWMRERYMPARIGMKERTTRRRSGSEDRNVSYSQWQRGSSPEPEAGEESEEEIEL